MQISRREQRFLRDGTLKLAVAGLLFIAANTCFAVHTNNIMLTGYWPPTNNMLVQFSTDPALNPGGWQGRNWSNTSYDVYAYFPTFPGGTGSNPKGTGDFEVDYQDTSADFWRIVDEIHPVAILSYGNGAGPWEIEYNARNLPKNSWVSDYQNPKKPDSKPEIDMPDNYVRHSTLPVDTIAQAIDQAGLGVNAWVDYNGNPGAFLCEYMAYHVMWYQDIHKDPFDLYQCAAAGFTHVSGSLTLAQAVAASDIALGVTIDYLNTVVSPEPATIALLGLGVLALLRKRKA